MKYMGSKRVMLENGLGELLRSEVSSADRFVDLFSGTGRVSWYVANLAPVPVIATDLQEYSMILGRGVLSRTAPIPLDLVREHWLDPVAGILADSGQLKLAARARTDGMLLDRTAVLNARALCAEVDGGVIWRSYGGHYFSPSQAATIDILLEHLPGDEPLRSTCHAILVLVASVCAASPGHTAQPFQPTPSALPSIWSAWSRDPMKMCMDFGSEIAARFAMVEGRALVADANEFAKEAGEGDLVFLDPPYSSVHYSRFYHVLETVARGQCGPTSGVGRYPPLDERPRSDYSMKSTSATALLDLLATLGSRGCRVVLTFPQGVSSNGMEGEDIIEAARHWFDVDGKVVASRFSTLGGNNGNRAARRRTGEMIIRMAPR